MYVMTYGVIWHASHDYCLVNILCWLRRSKSLSNWSVWQGLTERFEKESLISMTKNHWSVRQRITDQYDKESLISLTPYQTDQFENEWLVNWQLIKLFEMTNICFND